MNFHGVHVPLVTPFLADGEIDHAKLASHAQNLSGRGLSGLGVGGTTGEYYALSFDERLKTFDTVAAAVGGKIDLIAGINATTTTEVIRLGKAAKSAGFNSVLVAAPYYAQPTQDELLAHLQKVDDAVDLPIMLYNFPARTGTEISDAVLETMLERKNVVAMKESTGDISHLHHLMMHYSDRFTVSCGMDDQALEFFAWGGKSWFGGAGNFLPELHVEMLDTCVNKGDFTAGRALMRKLLPVLELLEQGGKFIQYVRYGCELAGLEVGLAREPLGALTEAEKESLKAVVLPLLK
ncbi:dihydrodipicolinate synthase family protein [Leeia sp. TBRC 13508]|uniref:Dihydrodipicolinate synthase family protein n=1 Tax=Leeia speluncae TaxID=2884804 RepID=A0ABS8D1M3_9NEIS|nr:dihydrodipicolinate synthase family protein [Leeia speluncae]MCB6182089.1 dihydrodipicolinate synthase family protein [Leeia speluncae]